MLCVAVASRVSSTKRFSRSRGVVVVAREQPVGDVRGAGPSSPLPGDRADRLLGHVGGVAAGVGDRPGPQRSSPTSEERHDHGVEQHQPTGAPGSASGPASLAEPVPQDLQHDQRDQPEDERQQHHVGRRVVRQDDADAEDADQRRSRHARRAGSVAASSISARKKKATSCRTR